MSLIILAHPKFENSLANKTIIEELQNSGLDLEIRNIHTLYPDYKIDANAEQEALLRHHTVVFQYPLFWLGEPGILKHYIDEVLKFQFAYGPEGDKLEGKNFMMSITAGATEEAYKISGSHRIRLYEICKSLENMAYYTKMDYNDPLCLYGVSSGNKEANIEIRAKQHANILIKRLTELNLSSPMKHDQAI